MKLFVLVQPGGYCDETRVIGVFDSYDKALAGKQLSDNFGSEIREMELNVVQNVEWREVKPDGSINPNPLYAEAVKRMAQENPYIKLLDNIHMEELRERFDG